MIYTEDKIIDAFNAVLSADKIPLSDLPHAISSLKSYDYADYLSGAYKGATQTSSPFIRGEAYTKCIQAFLDNPNLDKNNKEFFKFGCLPADEITFKNTLPLIENLVYKDKDSIKQFISVQPLYFSTLKDEVRDNPEFALHALKSADNRALHQGIIHGMSSRLQNMVGVKDVIDKLENIINIQDNFSALDASLMKKFGDDKEYVMDNIWRNGNLLQFVSADLKNDTDIVLVALKQNPCAIKFIGEELKQFDTGDINKTIENIENYKPKSKPVKNVVEVKEEQPKPVVSTITKKPFKI